jgi:hypothetical protein
VLESADAAAARGVAPIAYVGRYRFGGGGTTTDALTSADDTPGLWLTPNAFADGSIGESRATLPQLSLSSTFGDLYGATGVMQALAATLWLAAAPRATALATTSHRGGAATANILIHGAQSSGAKAC